jgi:hypothetical protein
MAGQARDEMAVETLEVVADRGYYDGEEIRACEEAGRNVEVMWLLGRLAPDHKTIADFRKDNGLALRRVCARFVELCRGMGLLTTASVAIDGSKFKAVNNRDKNFTRAKVERRRAQLEESVARYLSQLDTADRQEPTEALAAKVTRLPDLLHEGRVRRRVRYCRHSTVVAGNGSGDRRRPARAIVHRDGLISAALLEAFDMVEAGPQAAVAGARGRHRPRLSAFSGAGSSCGRDRDGGCHLDLVGLWFFAGSEVTVQPRSTPKGIAAGLGSGITSMVAHSGGSPAFCSGCIRLLASPVPH